MLRPADRVVRYLPNRSTMPARACGTIFTVIETTATASTASRIRTMVMADIRPPCL
jgi:hypothetical protein